MVLCVCCCSRVTTLEPVWLRFGLDVSNDGGVCAFVVPELWRKGQQPAVHRSRGRVRHLPGRVPGAGGSDVSGENQSQPRKEMDKTWGSVSVKPESNGFLVRCPPLPLTRL